MSNNFNVKKITLFAPNLEGGGAERIISILAIYFSEKGLPVDLILAKASGPYLKNIPPTVNIIDFKCKKVILSLPKLIKYLRTEKTEILFSSQMHSSSIALWAVKISGVNTKVVIRQPTMLRPAFEKKSFRNKITEKILLWSAKKWAYKIIVTSKVMFDEFIKITKISSDKLSIIYNPLPIETIQERSKELLQHPWFQEGNPSVILAVGRLVHVKNFETLIKSFSIVKKKIDTRLVILGEGPLRQNLEQLIENLDIKPYVEMPGFVENPFQYMKCSKVFVMSSLWEGFPNGMIEAMACGTAIIATDCEGGASEILEYGKLGQLVPVQNHIKMAEAIIYAIESTSLPNTKKKISDFSMNKIAMRYADEIGINTIKN